ncbi:MAG TPA: hypothetical protein VN258_01085 [Mobilitalea sp.]|nr:hypothetical protein [Mobilitalea sp.]
METAYDVGAVIQNLEDSAIRELDGTALDIILIDDAISILKGAVKDE